MAVNSERKVEKRIDLLSRPKPLPHGFIDDRRSVYWDNEITKDWSKSDNSTKIKLSERQEQLTLPKPVHKEWSGDRPSPIWHVSEAAMKSQGSERLTSLAEPKTFHRDFQPPKSVFTIVTGTAKNASASQRVETLALPKQYKELPIKLDSCWDWGEWESDLSKAALQCEPSGRIIQLAQPKSLNSAYKELRPVIWPVSAGAKKALPSIRVQQLARPKSRSQYKEDYDCNWWKVTPGAKNARATPRIEELALPLPRKIRQKKVAKT